MSRSEAKSIAENNGGKVLGSISKKLDFLIVGNSKPTKRKIDQAKKLDIKIITEKEWNKILNGWTSFFKLNFFIFVHIAFQSIENFTMIIINPFLLDAIKYIGIY